MQQVRQQSSDHVDHLEALEMCNSRLYRVKTKVGLRLNGGFLDVAL